MLSKISAKQAHPRGDFKDHRTGLRGDCSTQYVTLMIITQVSGVSLALRGDFKDHNTGLRGEFSTQM